VATQFFSRRNRSRQGIRWLADRRTAFIAIYTLVPLSIFVVFSLFHEVKLNWTGPLWLAVLPAIARSLAGESAASQVPTFNGAWRATIVIALLIYGAVFHYMAFRVPDIGNLSLKMLPIAWEELGEQVERSRRISKAQPERNRFASAWTDITYQAKRLSMILTRMG
jgi:hypothetical protein